MNFVGLRVTCTDCKILKRDQFPGNNGNIVYQCHLQGFGFSYVLRTNDQEVNNSWPPRGTIVNLSADLTPAKDGLFRMENPSLEPVRPVAPPK